jgi:hypothetical protein
MVKALVVSVSYIWDERENKKINKEKEREGMTDERKGRKYGKKES